MVLDNSNSVSIDVSSITTRHVNEFEEKLKLIILNWKKIDFNVTEISRKTTHIMVRRY